MITIPDTEKLLTGSNNGSYFIAKLNPADGSEIKIKIPDTAIVVTSSWFYGILRYANLKNIRVEFVGGDTDTKEQLVIAQRRIDLSTPEAREASAVSGAIRILEKHFEHHPDFVRLLKESDEDRYSLTDIFDANTTKDPGVVEIIDDADNFYHRKLNRAQLSAVVVSLLKLSLGD